MEYFTKEEQEKMQKKKDDMKRNQHKIELYSQNNDIIKHIKESIGDKLARYVMLFFDSQITKFKLKTTLQK